MITTAFGGSTDKVTARLICENCTDSGFQEWELKGFMMYRKASSQADLQIGG